MKLITFVVPCYNSEDYMSKCIDSLIPGGDDVEIIVVDDGSSDRTAEIADEYEKKYPGLIRVIHQENKGHGGAINSGLKVAEGMYFKVIDSDDWVDEESYKEVIATLKRLVDEGNPIDMLLTNYVYEKLSTDHERRMLFSFMFPSDQIIGWKDMKRVVKGFTIIMHAVTYRTALLRDECKLVLPEHTFYEDNLFAYLPLPYVKTLYYLNTSFYRYYIGREGQSVSEQIMIKRIDQQIKVNKMLIDAYDVWQIKERNLRKYMLSFLEIISTVTSSLGYLSGTPENMRKVKDLWHYAHEKAPKTYWHMRLGIFGLTSNLPGRGGRKIYLKCYHTAQKFVGFN